MSLSRLVPRTRLEAREDETTASAKMIIAADRERRGLGPQTPRSLSEAAAMILNADAMRRGADIDEAV